MPCNSDYLDPTHRELELQRTARLVQYVQPRLTYYHFGGIPNWVANMAAANGYLNREKGWEEDGVVLLLCEMLRSMSREQQERIIYNAHDPVARDLADWYEEHKRADEERETQERHQRENEALRASALSKLTPAEIEALGLDEVAKLREQVDTARAVIERTWH